MNQVTQLFGKLSNAQRIFLAAAVMAVVGGIVSLSHWNQERDFKPLFTGIASEDAGPLLAKLKESNTEYRLTDSGTTVLVPSGRVDELRIEMASAGLPKSGRIGFELFDKTNFGASEFAEQVNYHRAIEGELERSVMSIREVEQARVHITLAKDSLYAESRQPAKASVLVKLHHAAGLSPQNVAAICQLTASAVPGLAPEQVSVVDTSGNLLNRPRAGAPSDSTGGGEESLDYRKTIERDLQGKIAATLEPLLGVEHFRAGVSADVDITSAEQSEEVFDPQKSVMATSQTTQDGPPLPFASGMPGTPSNLPNPAAKPVTGASNYARHTENVTYQTSRVVKHTRLPQGAVKRLSLSILVDHTLRWDAGKRIVDPPSPEKLKVIHDMVAAATGLDTNRGDQLVVEAFPFESTLTAEPLSTAPATAVPPASPLPPWLQNLWEKSMTGKSRFITAGVGAGLFLALIAGAFLLRARSRAKRRKVEAVLKTAAIAAAETAPPAAAGIATSSVAKQIAAQSAEQARIEAEQLMALKVPAQKSQKTQVLSKHIATEAATDPAALARVVRTWLNG
jgi:flagellar M-ring protein FliF